MSEVLFLSALTAVGAALLLPARRLIPTWQLAILAAPLGQVAWALAGLAWFVSPVGFDPWRTAATLAALSVLSLLLHVRSNSVAQALIPVTMAAVFASVVAAFFVVTNPSTMTNDSIWLVTIGKVFAETGGLDAAPDLIVLWSFPLFPSLLQSGAEIASVSYLVAAAPLFNLAGLAILITWLREDLIRLGTTRRDANITSLLVLLVFLTTLQISYQVVYIRGNLEFAIALALFAVCGWRGAARRDAAWWALGFPLLAGASLLRVEAPLYLLVYLGALAVLSGMARPARVKITGGYAVFIWLIYGWLFLPHGTGAVLDTTSIWVILGVSLILVGVSAAPNDASFFWNAVTRVVKLTVPVFLIAVSSLFVIRPDQMNTWFSGFWRYFVDPLAGLWGVTWLLLAVLSIIVWRFGTAPPHQQVLSIPAAATGILIFALGFFAGGPFSANWAASLNRLLSAVLLPGFYVVVLRMAPFLSPSKTALVGDRQA